jgi:hypothetical protein
MDLIVGTFKRSRCRNTGRGGKRAGRERLKYSLIVGQELDEIGIWDAR